MSEDFLDFFAELLAGEAIFLLVGAHAMAVHGVPRATGDLDLWVRPDLENAQRVWQAAARFGIPLEALGFRVEDLTQPGIVWQMGVPPNRIDLMTQIDGVSFEEAWKTRITTRIGTLTIPVIALESLRRNKAAAGREKDRLDLELLSSARST